MAESFTSCQRYVDRCVERGVVILNHAAPVWFHHVDPSVIDLWNGKYCILGQVFGTFHAGTVALGWHAESEWYQVLPNAKRCGFLADEPESAITRYLETRWRTVVTQRHRALGLRAALAPHHQVASTGHYFTPTLEEMITVG